MAVNLKTSTDHKAPGTALRSAVTSRTTPKINLEIRIRESLSILAVLLEEDDVYLPIFLRLEKELQTVRDQQDALTRARSYIRECA